MDFATRILIAILDWIARRNRQAATRPIAKGDYDGADSATAAMHSRFGGRGWRYDAEGVHADGKVWRTAGEPVTCRAILALYGEIIIAAGKAHGVSPALIVMTIAAETAAYRASGFSGPRTFRWESHVLNSDVRPPLRGTYSAGPMQVLATTARELIATKGKAYGLALDGAAVAPAIRKRPVAAPKTLALYDPVTSIALGTAVIRRQLPLTGGDPILVAAAYNSGGVYRSSGNAWRLRSHGDHLDRAARWYGDACAVLGEMGVR